MSKEILISQIKEMGELFSENSREGILTNLKNCHTHWNGRLKYHIEWKRENIYFHSLQDLLWTSEFGERKELKRYISRAQACFAIDLGNYLVGFPKEETEMREVFETVLAAGTSFYWKENIPICKKLYKVYKQLNEEIIIPWTKRQSAPQR